MNLPNKLTVLRILLVPFFVFFLLSKQIPYNYFFAIIIFIFASITDHLDGKIARKNNQITDFGKFLDPIADKILVISAFICFIELRFISSLPVIIILMREFVVTSFRLMMVSRGKVIAANFFGKLKTVSQIFTILFILFLKNIFLFFNYPDMLNIFEILSNSLVWVTALLSTISGVIYISKDVDIIKNMK